MVASGRGEVSGSMLEGVAVTSRTALTRVSEANSVSVFSQLSARTDKLPSAWILLQDRVISQKGGDCRLQQHQRASRQARADPEGQDGMGPSSNLDSFFSQVGFCGQLIKGVLLVRSWCLREMQSTNPGGRPRKWQLRRAVGFARQAHRNLLPANSKDSPQVELIHTDASQEGTADVDRMYQTLQYQRADAELGWVLSDLKLDPRSLPHDPYPLACCGCSH